MAVVACVVVAITTKWGGHRATGFAIYLATTAAAHASRAFTGIVGVNLQIYAAVLQVMSDNETGSLH